MKLIKRDWQKGRTEYSDWIIEQFPPLSFSLRRRYHVQDVPYDDNYLQEEIEFLKKVIKPTDICVEFANRVVTGVLSKLCKKVYVVVYNSEYMLYSLLRIEIEMTYSEMRKEFYQKNVEILYGYGMYLYNLTIV